MSLKKVFFLFLCVSAFACSRDSEEDLKESPVINETGDSDTCNTEGITYNSRISMIMTEHCNAAGCHSDNSGRSLTSYNQLMVYVNNGTFNNRVLDRKDMPPATSLSDCELKKISDWLASGSPE